MHSGNEEDLLHRIDQLNSIGIALSAERDTERLLEMILVGAKTITNADGGSIYTVEPDRRHLRLAIMRTESLDLAMGGTTGRAVPFDAIPLFESSGEANKRMVVTCAVHEGRTIAVADAYSSEEFDFSGTRGFDRQTGYRSRSFLTVPLRDHENQINGVLQLINAVDGATGDIVSFSDSDQRLTESLASQAAVALTKKQLIDGMQELFDAFVRLIATAIDEKSPHTGDHCRKVPVLTMALADAANHTSHGPLAEFILDEDGRYELDLASWLHDCGKITTPEWVVEKGTKLQTIFDRIELVDTRFEVLRRDAEVERLEGIVEALRRGAESEVEAIERAYEQRLEVLEDDRRFLHECNLGVERMSSEDQHRVRRIARRRWHGLAGESLPLLTDDEVHNLTIVRGTLTPEERRIIDNHIVATIKMLDALPFPRHLQNVPEYAGAHHERVDGTGHPRGLTREQMSVPARIMAIADVFEALTSSSRPYKDPMPLSQALAILGRMSEAGHVDPDLFDVFVRERVWEGYAAEHLEPSQVDEIDLTALPGYGGAPQA
jgi:HD-GYP domain-containing protein (c-di-GMP phosphodiesterase class II)